MGPFTGVRNYTQRYKDVCWHDDGVEIYFQKRSSDKGILHFIVDAGGKWFAQDYTDFAHRDAPKRELPRPEVRRQSGKGEMDAGTRLPRPAARRGRRGNASVRPAMAPGRYIPVQANHREFVRRSVFSRSHGEDAVATPSGDYGQRSARWMPWELLKRSQAPGLA